MALSGVVGIGAGLGAVLLIKAIAAVGWVAEKVSEATSLKTAWVYLTLPVVDETDPTQLVAMLRREDVVAAYHRALGATAQARTRHDQLGARTYGKTRFFESVIASGSLAEGRAVSELPWPEGCVAVSVHRGSGLLVPNGRKIIRAGDTITTFGSDEARDRLIERLAPPPEPETAEDGR